MTGSRVYVLHENPEWLPPIATALSAAGVDWEPWLLDGAPFELTGPPPAGVFLWTAGFFVVWQQIEGNALAPLVMRYAVRIPPAVTLFALFLFGGLFGIGGIILGGPLTVATWMMVRRLWIDEREKADV